MICQYLYNSLFRSSLPFSGILRTQTLSEPKIAKWCLEFSDNLTPYTVLFGRRVQEKREFIGFINKQLSRLRLWTPDRLDMLERQFAELQAAYAADAVVGEEQAEADETAFLLDHEKMQKFLNDNTEQLLQACPTFTETADEARIESYILAGNAYTAFEGMLILCDCDEDVIFDYSHDKDRIFSFLLTPAFPVSTEAIESKLVFKNICEYKIFCATYAEIMDALFATLNGKQYIYANLSSLVEYYLDVIGYSYATNYKNFLATCDPKLLTKVDNFPGRFEFHFLNFLSNIEHMRCAIHAFLNRQTMKMLSAIVGQYNILERHKKRHQGMDSKRDSFANVIDDLWKNNTQLRDHIDMLAFIQITKTKKIRELAQLFGSAKTKKIVIEVLQKYNAVRGMPGFMKRNN